MAAASADGGGKLTMPTTAGTSFAPFVPRVHAEERRGGRALSCREGCGLTDTQTDAPGKAEGAGGPGGAGRARRLVHGWSANLVQMVLGLTQQLLLIPAFLHVWSGDMLAAWLAIYAAGSLVIVADAGLQFRAINRFLAFKSCADCDGRTAQLLPRHAADLSCHRRRARRPARARPSISRRRRPCSVFTRCRHSMRRCW